MSRRSRRAQQIGQVATAEAPAKSRIPRINQTWLGLAVLAVLIVGAGYWLLAGAGPTRFSEADLTAMLLDKDEAGAAYERLAYASEFSGLISNASFVAVAFDNQDARLAADAVTDHMRVRGAAQAYVLETNTPATSGPVYLFSQADLYRREAGAIGHFSDMAQRPLHVGETSRHGLYVVAAERFNPLDVGEQAAGQVAVTSYQAGALGQVVVYTTTITFRRGRLIGRVGVDRADPANIRDEVAHLARELDRRMADAQR